MAIDQTGRLIKVTSPLGDDKLILTSLDAWERLSGLFQFNCKFTSEDENLKFEDIVGKAIAIEIEASGESTRHFHGMVSRFAQSDADASNVVYQAQLVPWLWFLTRSTDCRIFQQKSVTDIIKEVFDDLGFSDYKFDLEGSYDPIPYCVQYRETDFNFVSRLLEEYGIGYYFTHAADKHELVLFDSNAKVGACPGQPEASYESDEGDSNTAGQVLEWSRLMEFRSGAYALSDYTYSDPSLSLGVEKKTKNAVGGNDRFEVYDYPGEYAALKVGDKRAQLRIEAEEAAAHLIQGSGTCFGFSPGYKFDLKGHYRDSFNDTYLLTEVRHTFSQGVGTGDATSSYENSFDCMPHAVAYRPLQKTPKPVIQGVQTALVVGEGGKEIDVDDQARIVVQFHWDRKGKKDASSSCRVRVSQAWAGKEWGAYYIPRIGQEVIVEFEEGDPDRPIVTGRVYNAEQKPPYGGTGEHSGIKSRSTAGGGSSNFNELRMEDKKGSELFFVQAEKDQTINVKNDLSETVGNNETQTVGADQSITVGANRTDNVGSNETRGVGADRTRTVGKNESVSIALTRTRNVGVNDMINVGAAQEITVGGAQAISVGGAQATSVGGAQATNVGANRSVSAGKNISEDAGDNYEINAGKDYSLEAGKKIVISAGDEIVLKAGKAEISMKKNGDITINGKKIDVKASANIVMKGSKILQN